jgi:hypothetical protein
MEFPFQTEHEDARKSRVALVACVVIGLLILSLVALWPKRASEAITPETQSKAQKPLEAEPAPIQAASLSRNEKPEESPATSAQSQFEVKDRDVYLFSISKNPVGADLDSQAEAYDAKDVAPLFPKSNLDDDCKDGWEPYATERVTQDGILKGSYRPHGGPRGTPNAVEMKRVFMRYHLKRKR